MGKKWTFMIKVFGINRNTKEPIEFGRFETEGISPYKVVSGAKSMGSQDYDHISSGMAMADFISKIGDKNTLSVKKLHCPLTDTFVEAQKSGKKFTGINVYVTPLSAISARLKGEPRLASLLTNSLEMVMFPNVHVTYSWREYVANYNSPTVLYDYVTFESKDEPKFLFKGKDW